MDLSEPESESLVHAYARARGYTVEKRFENACPITGKTDFAVFLMKSTHDYKSVVRDSSIDVKVVVDSGHDMSFAKAYDKLLSDILRTERMQSVEELKIWLDLVNKPSGL